MNTQLALPIANVTTVPDSYAGDKSSRVRHLESQLATLGYNNALRAFDLVLAEMNADKGYKRHDGKHYYYHLVDVAQILLNFGIKDDEDIITAALLHDFIEDVPWATYEYVQQLFNTRVADMVLRLSKDPHVDYKQNLDEMDRYLAGIYEMVETALIKTADRIHNFSSMYVSSNKHRMKQVVETRNFYIPFFKQCRNRYARYSNFFFFAKTTIEPILLEIEQSVNYAEQIEVLKQENQKLNDYLDRTFEERDKLKAQIKNQPTTLQTILAAIDHMEQQDTVTLKVKSISADSILYDALDGIGRFITHIEVQFDNHTFNGTILKCIPNDENFEDTTWVDRVAVQNKTLRDYIADTAITMYEKRYPKPIV